MPKVYDKVTGSIPVGRMSRPYDLFLVLSTVSDDFAWTIQMIFGLFVWAWVECVRAGKAWSGSLDECHWWDRVSGVGFWIRPCTIYSALLYWSTVYVALPICM